MQLSSLFHVRYRRSGFTVNDTFTSPEGMPDADINYYIQSPENVSNALHEFYTLLIDLRQEQDTIWKGIYHRTRSEISSFIHNQDFEHRVITEPSQEQLSEFIKLFNVFAKLKDIRKAEDFRLEAYSNHKLLAISWIRQNGRYLCMNVYRVNRQRATNLYSFTLKHTDHITSRSLFGRAHRALHWLDILFFQQQGVGLYDFCGWYEGNKDKELLNINKFKEQFTSYKVKEYSGVIYKNRWLKFLKRLR